jgi:hypothetical protein
MLPEAAGCINTGASVLTGQLSSCVQVTLINVLLAVTALQIQQHHVHGQLLPYKYNNIMYTGSYCPTSTTTSCTGAVTALQVQQHHVHGQLLPYKYNNNMYRGSYCPTNTTTLCTGAVTALEVQQHHVHGPYFICMPCNISSK